MQMLCKNNERKKKRNSLGIKVYNKAQLDLQKYKMKNKQKIYTIADIRITLPARKNEKERPYLTHL